MKNKEVKKYFSEKAKFWLSEAYGNNKYSYPLGFHRTRIAIEIIKSKFNSKDINLIDVGCGAGNLCILAAKLGYNSIGIDQSKEMLNEANKKLLSLPNDVATRVKFINCNFLKNSLTSNAYNIITAMGFIGYLEDDDSLFSNAKRLLKSGGILIVSCRNRLFNMTSISDYTSKEIEDGYAPDLIKEIEGLYKDIPDKEFIIFIKNLEKNIREISNNLKYLKKEKSRGKFSDLTSINPRQHTPKQLSSVAKKNGFINLGYYGVHPHLFIPKLNYLLPPKVFNKLSDSLNAFEKLPISLIWSSCFIGVFEKL